MTCPTPSPYYPASPIEIRDGTAQRLAAVPGLKSILKAVTKPLKEYSLPAAVVYNDGERTEPWGDANAGAPKFEHRLTLVVDFIATASSEAALDIDVVALVETAKQTLLSDSTWLQLFEAVERIDTRYVYPRETTDYVVQGVLELELFYRSQWDPVVPHWFEQVGMRINTGDAKHDNPIYSEFDIPRHVSSKGIPG